MALRWRQRHVAPATRDEMTSRAQLRPRADPIPEMVAGFAQAPAGVERSSPLPFFIPVSWGQFGWAWGRCLG